MNHVLVGAALGGTVIALSRLLDAETSISMDYYFLMLCFGSAASVVYKRTILKF